MRIVPYSPLRKEEILSLSIRAWEPVFPQVQAEVPDFVYRSFYPAGWVKRQVADLSLILDHEPDTVWVAVEESEAEGGGDGGEQVHGDAGESRVALGWVCVRMHPEDRMGEIYVLAVDPSHQRRGLARALMDHAFAQIRAAGMGVVMVETGDDPGHSPSRATYEALGFKRWPVARYFKDLSS